MLGLLIRCRTIPTWQSLAALGPCGHKPICYHWAGFLAREVGVEGGMGHGPGSVTLGTLSSEAGDL